MSCSDIDIYRNHTHTYLYIIIPCIYEYMYTHTANLTCPCHMFVDIIQQSAMSFYHLYVDFTQTDLEAPNKDSVFFLLGLPTGMLRGPYPQGLLPNNIASAIQSMLGKDQLD